MDPSAMLLAPRNHFEFRDSEYSVPLLLIEEEMDNKVDKLHQRENY